jgi:flagellar hook protein FlgE
MNSLSAISLSGMQAAQTQLGTSAHNIANGMTAGFTRKEVVQEADPSGGVSTSLVSASTQQQSIEMDIVQQLQAKNSFLANLTVFRSSNQMMGSLLNLQA